MTREEFDTLRTGDIVRGRATAQGYVVTGHYGHHVTAVRTINITNPDEWELILKSSHHVTPVEQS